jgi:hypothetical protein
MAPIPLSPYGTLQGSLFQYKSSPSMVAFESFPRKQQQQPQAQESEWMRPNKCILVGGLGDGLLPTPYTALLEEALPPSWSLVQPLMSSSGTGFGHGSLSRDSDELTELLHYLIQHRSAQHFAFVGHSTGCQNAVHLCRQLSLQSSSSSSSSHEQLKDRIKVIVLQAPVSDREHAMMEPNYEEHLAMARRLVEDAKDAQGATNNNDATSPAMMPRSAFWAPISADRFLALQEYAGDDDYFSSDLTEQVMLERLEHMSHYNHILVAFSGSDEYVPSHVKKSHLVDRLCHSMTMKQKQTTTTETSTNNHVVPLLLEHGNHNLSLGKGDAELFVQEVVSMLNSAIPPLNV